MTPQQHQLLLGVAGYTGRQRASISELAEFLQERHNSVVELVGRAMRRGLLRKQQDPRDRRCAAVSLTPRGERVLSRLSLLHQGEVARLQSAILMAEGPWPFARGKPMGFAKRAKVGAKRGAKRAAGESAKATARHQATQPEQGKEGSKRILFPGERGQR